MSRRRPGAHPGRLLTSSRRGVPGSIGRYKRDPWFTRGPLLALVALLIVASVALAVHDYAKIEPVTVTVEDKESVTVSGFNQYRIYTDSATYVITDSWVRPQFNSADVYRKIKPGTTYRCESFGWRIPFLSKFKHLRKCQEV